MTAPSRLTVLTCAVHLVALGASRAAAQDTTKVNEGVRVGVDWPPS